MLGIAVALALLVVAGRIQQGALMPHRPASAPAPATMTARPLPVTATIGLGAPAAPPFAGEAQLMVGEGRLWAVVDGVLVGVDPRRARAVARIRPGRPGRPGDFVSLLAVGAGAVWVATGTGVVRVDPATNQVAATLPNDNPPWAAGAGSLWSVQCTSEQGPCRPLRLDPRNLRATARFPLPGMPAGLPAVGDDAVWLLDQSGRWVWRMDLTGARVAKIRLPSAASSADVPSQLVVGEGVVWVLTSVESPTRLGVRVDAGLIRIDPHANRVSAHHAAGQPRQRHLTNPAGRRRRRRLGRGPASTGPLGARRDRPGGPGQRPRARHDRDRRSQPAALAAGFGVLWLLRPAADALLRLDPAAM